MRSTKVALVDLGGGLPLGLPALTWRLNSLQGSFKFSYGGALALSALGTPDVEDERYDAPSVFRVMSDNYGSSAADYVIGITRAKLTNKAEWRDKPDKDYFSLSDLSRYSIVSVNPKVLQFGDPSKGAPRYVAFLTLCELLINCSNTNLSHYGEEICLLNECEDRSVLAECMNAARLCPSCTDALQIHGLDERTIADSNRILAWCRRNTWEAALKQAVTNPLSSLGLGTGIGWFASAFLGKERSLVIVAVTLIPALLVFLLHKFGRGR